MNDLQREVKALQDDLAAGRITIGDARTWCATMAKQIIVKDYQADMVRGIMKNLMIYGTGRLPGIDEMTEIRTIMKEHRPEDYPLRDLLKAVVRSRAFLEQHQ